MCGSVRGRPDALADTLRAEREGEVHRLRDQHEQRAEDRGPGLHDRALVDRRRARAAARDREGEQESDRQAAPALQKLPKVGYIRTTQSLAWDLHYARKTPLDEGGRRIVLATDRPIGFWEARNQPRSIDYPFTILEMHLDKNDEGSGKILVGTKIYIDKKTNNIVLENYAQQPVMLNEIKKVK